MHPVQLILKKRNGGEHSPEEIRYFIEELSSGRLESYQAAAWLMATWFRGMTAAETDVLTQAMVESGDQIDLSSIPGIKVDKHSTGGVGDGTSLIIAPIVAAAGGRVAKMSGRGLGHTGGTLDKLESIPGMSVDLTQEQFFQQVNDIGLAIISQTGKLVPADGILYALRDVTGTVDSIPLIAASVMSKKLACGADAILLDVKFGHGAFMKDLEGARQLAQTMVEIGRRRGRRVKAALSSMDAPLGRQIGNALEIDEALQILRGLGQGSPLRMVALELAAHLIHLSQLTDSLELAQQKVSHLVDSGQALKRLAQMIRAQGGDASICDNPGKLPQAQHQLVLESPQSGYLQGLEAETVGTAAMFLGAGRQKKSDTIDPAVGLVLQAQRGDKLEAGQPLATLHYNSSEHLEAARQKLASAFHIGTEPPPEEPLIREFIGG